MRLYISVVGKSSRYDIGEIILCRNVIATKGRIGTLFSMSEDGKTVLDKTNVVGLGYVDVDEFGRWKHEAMKEARKRLKKFDIPKIMETIDDDYD
jgi:hypothetical protein